MNIFTEISLILVIAAGMALVMQFLRLPLLLGHLLTGILVGPLLLNLIHAQDTIGVFSQLGITALLFIVGLNLSPKVMREVGKASLIAGIGQILLTFPIGFSIALLFGFSMAVSAYIGLALSFSSTIIALKFLSDRKDVEQLYGKITTGILLVQDVFATIVLLVVSSWGGSVAPPNAFLVTALKFVGLLVGIWLINRFIVVRLTRVFAASQEFLFLFAVGWALGIAALFHAVGLSLEIGALAAGITLASSPYHYEIGAKIKLLRDFFLILFFILLGSQITLGASWSLFAPLLAFVFVLNIVNPALFMILLGLMGYAKKTSFYVAILLSQMSEFSFLLVMIGARNGHLPQELVSLLTLAGLASIAISSVLILNVDRLYARLAPVLSVFESGPVFPERRRRERFDILLFGCHRVGGDFLLSMQKRKKKYLVVDFDPAVVDDLKRHRIPCRYGDAEDTDFLDDLGLENVEMLVSTIPDTDANLFLLEKTRNVNEDALVILVAQSVDEAMLLYQQGATYVIMPHFLGGNYASQLLDRFGVDPGKFHEERARHVEHLSRRHSVVTGEPMSTNKIKGF